MARAGDDVGDRVGDVRRPAMRSIVAEALLRPSRISSRRWSASSVVDRAGLDERDAHVAARDLLAQRLAERADAVLREVVDARRRCARRARRPS